MDPFGLEGAMGKPLDWNDVRFFLAVAREGTLAKAAHALGVDQTTVGRRITALEARLRTSVFARTPSGFELTAAGRRMVDAAARMNEAAIDLSACVGGDDEDSGETVVVATTESLAEYFIVPAIRELHARRPRICVALRTGWHRADLRRGDADLAVRIVRPSDPRLACRKLGDYCLRLYASTAYVARRGVPQSLRDHALLGYDEALRSAGSIFTSLSVDDGYVAMQANSGGVLLAAVVAGLGIAQLPSYVGESVPELTPVLPGYDKPYAVWLVLPEGKRRVAAVRAVSDAIVAAFRRPPAATGADNAAE
jgi:DNA-binding transcriptional LysR family regulator